MKTKKLTKRKLNLAKFPVRDVGPVAHKGFIAELRKYKNTQTRYRVACDMVAEPEGHAWWVNAWLRGNPPVPTERGRI